MDRHPGDQRRPAGAETGNHQDQQRADQRQEDHLRPIGPIGAGEIGAQDQLLGDLGVDGDPGQGRVQRRRPEVGKPCRAGSDEHDRALDLRAIELPGHDPPGRHEADRLLAGLVEPGAARGVRRHGEPADAHADDAGFLAEGRLAAGAGAFHQQGGCALGDAQRLQRHRRVDLVVEIDQQRDPADDPVALGHQVHAAAAGRRLGDLGQVDDRSLEARHEQPGIVSRIGVTGPRQRGWAAAVRPERESEHDVAGPTDRFGKQAVMALQRTCPGSECLVDELVRPQLEDLVGRGAVRLGEHDVEHHHRRPGLGQPVQKARKDDPRPRPLTVPGEALVVEIDDAHRQRLVGARLQFLEIIKDPNPQVADHHRVPRAQRQAQDQHRDRQQVLQPRHQRACPPAGRAICAGGARVASCDQAQHGGSLLREVRGRQRCPAKIPPPL